jgi:hypothetical protein
MRKQTDGALALVPVRKKGRRNNGWERSWRSSMEPKHFRTTTERNRTHKRAPKEESSRLSSPKPDQLDELRAVMLANNDWVIEEMARREHPEPIHLAMAD